MDIETALNMFGLNEKEIKVYIALLDLKQATAQQIARKTGILRQTIYDIIDSLKQKGLASETTISNVNHYSASSPDNLLTIEDERRKAIEQALPELRELQKGNLSPKVQAFFGRKGVEKIYNDTLNSKEVFWIESYRISKQIIKDYWLNNYILRRKEKRVKINLISDVYDKKQKEWFKSSKKDLRETRFCKLITDWESGIVIYGNKVAIYSVKDNLIGVVIESEQIKQTFMKIFEMLWKMGTS